MIGTGLITYLTTAPFSSHQTDNPMKEDLDWLDVATTAKESAFMSNIEGGPHSRLEVG